MRFQEIETVVLYETQHQTLARRNTPTSCLSFKVPISEFFLFSYLNLNITLRTSVKKFFDLHKTQIFYEFYKTFKFAAILAHHSH